MDGGAGLPAVIKSYVDGSDVSSSQPRPESIHRNRRWSVARAGSVQAVAQAGSWLWRGRVAQHTAHQAIEEGRCARARSISRDGPGVEAGRELPGFRRAFIKRWAAGAVVAESKRPATGPDSYGPD